MVLFGSWHSFVCNCFKTLYVFWFYFLFLSRVYPLNIFLFIVLMRSCFLLKENSYNIKWKSNSVEFIFSCRFYLSTCRRSFFSLRYWEFFRSMVARETLIDHSFSLLLFIVLVSYSVLIDKIEGVPVSIGTLAFWCKPLEFCTTVTLPFYWCNLHRFSMLTSFFYTSFLNLFLFLNFLNFMPD